jgi:hypothetical protein
VNIMKLIGGIGEIPFLRPPLLSLGFLRPTCLHLRPNPVTAWVFTSAATSTPKSALSDGLTQPLTPSAQGRQTPATATRLGDEQQHPPGSSLT